MQTALKNKTEADLLERQLEIQSRCYHPEGGFEPFNREDIEESISARFEQIVEKYPNRLAIKADTGDLTYAALNRIANHLARAILAAHNDDAPIVLLLEHGTPMVCGILAVLKAGRIYVPLDPLYPHARNAHIMADSQAGVIITNNKNLQYAQELTERRMLLVNIDEIKTDQKAENLSLSISPEQPAYILYTSGSTGQPKGVYQSHINLLHNIMQYTNTLHLCRHDRMTLLYSFNVNGSLRGIFGSLLNGAALFPYDIKAKGLANLGTWLRQEEITFYHSVPTVFRHFIDSLDDDERFPSVRLIRFGGERVPVDNVAFYKKHFLPHCILYTGMGSTETSTVRQYFTDYDTQFSESVIPTGYPVEERDVFILDENGQEADVGEVGLISIKSPYLALGYWRKPEQTKKVFLPAPDDEKARIYLTGDLGRILPDGRLIHMGRKDAQVKVRGHRVETAEIEIILLKHAQIKEAAVVAWADTQGDKSLAAYTVAHGDLHPTADELYQFLRKSLPDYMIPAAYVSLDEMPLTPNSKINKRALPRPEEVHSETGTEFLPPRDELELKLLKLWEKVLSARPIGVKDNFFTIGGNSLLAVQLFTLIYRVLGQDLPLATLFQAPTIEQLANLLRDGGWQATWSSLVPLQPKGTKPPIFCVHAVGGNVLSLRDLAEHLGDEQPFYALQSKGLDGKHEIPGNVQEMARYYIEEVQSIQAQGPYFLTGQSSGGIIAFEMAQQLHAQGHTIAFLGLIDTYEPGMKKSQTITRADRIAYHKQNLAYSGWRYFVTQMQARWRRINRRITGKLSKRISDFYQALHRPIPYQIRHIIVRGMIQRAKKDYLPQPYMGSITLYRAVNTLRAFVEDRYGAQRGWKDLALGGVEICNILGAHNLEQEPFVGILAVQLKGHLAEAQTKYQA